MEEKVPFIAAIISGLVVTMASFLFFRDYFVFTLGILLLAILLLRFNPWTLIGSFILGLALQFYADGNEQNLQIVVGLLVSGTLLQLVLPANYTASDNSDGVKVSQLMLFGLIGLIIGYTIRANLCETLDVNSEKNWFMLIIEVQDCRVPFVQQAVQGDVTTDGVTFLTTLSNVVIRKIFVFPHFWCLVFVILRRFNFNVWRLRDILWYILKVGFSGFIIIGVIAIVVIFVYLLIIGAFSLNTEINKILSENPMLENILPALYVLLETYLTIWAFSTLARK